MEIVNGIRKSPIQLGNLDSVRDWGYAPDFVDAMILINSAKVAGDFVVSTGKIISVRDFLTISSKVAGFQPVFEGEGIEEKCIDKKSNKVICEINEKYFRPSDVTFLRGDYTKINKELGWSPSVYAEDLSKIMTEFDLNILSGKIKYFGI